jgi:hypothetical protein
MAAQSSQEADRVGIRFRVFFGHFTPPGDRGHGAGMNRTKKVRHHDDFVMLDSTDED